MAVEALRSLCFWCDSTKEGTPIDNSSNTYYYVAFGALALVATIYITIARAAEKAEEEKNAFEAFVISAVTLSVVATVSVASFFGVGTLGTWIASLFGCAARLPGRAWPAWPGARIRLC